jgi:hypothetical protein
MLRLAASSLVMVPRPWPSARVTPLVGAERLRKNVSLSSTLLSPLMVTEMVWVSPAVPVKLSVPEVAR